MKVKISRILLAILVVYAASWSSLNFFIQNNIKKILAKNSEFGIVLSYDEINVSGFPLNFTIKVSKPKFSMVSQQNDKNILANLLKSTIKGDEKKSKYISELLSSKKKSEFEIISNGELLINVSFLYKINEINFSGETKYSFKTKDDKFEILSKGENNLKLALNLPLYKIKKVSLKDLIFARFICKKCSLNNVLNNQKLYSADYSYIYLNGDNIGEKSSNIKIEYSQKNRIIEQSGIVFLRNLVNSRFFNEIINSNDFEPMLKYLVHFDNFTGSGKINYNGSTNEEEINKGNLKFSLQFPSTTKTSSYNGKSDLLLDFSMRDNVVKFSNFGLKGKYHFTDKFYDFLTANLSSLLPKSISQELKEKIAALPIDTKAKQYYKNNMSVFIPKIQDFKEIEVDSEIEYSNKKNKRKIKISEFGIKLPDYQFDLEGSYVAKMSGETAFNFESKIKNYRNFINLLFNYFRKIYSYGKMQNIEDLQKKDFFASENFKEMIASYLKKYGDKKSSQSNELELEIEKSYDSDKILINEQKVDFNMIVQQFLDAQIKFLLKKELKKQEHKIKNQIENKLNEKLNKILRKF